MCNTPKFTLRFSWKHTLLGHLTLELDPRSFIYKKIKKMKKNKIKNK
jgi:hypothetical protein